MGRNAVCRGQVTLASSDADKATNDATLLQSASLPPLATRTCTRSLPTRGARVPCPIFDWNASDLPSRHSSISQLLRHSANDIDSLRNQTRTVLDL